MKSMQVKVMKEGDLALYFLSAKEKSTLGIVKIVNKYCQDPIVDGHPWREEAVATVEKFNKMVMPVDKKIGEGLNKMALVSGCANGSNGSM